MAKLRILNIGRNEDDSINYHYNFDDGKIYADKSIQDIEKASAEGASKGSLFSCLIYPLVMLLPT